MVTMEKRRRRDEPMKGEKEVDEKGNENEYINPPSLPPSSSSLPFLRTASISPLNPLCRFLLFLLSCFLFSWERSEKGGMAGLSEEKWRGIVLRGITTRTKSTTLSEKEI